MIVNDFISHLVQKSAFFQIFDLNGFNTRGTNVRGKEYIADMILKKEESDNFKTFLIFNMSLLHP